MLEKLIKSFYDENDCLKDEVKILITKNSMIKIIAEVALLQANSMKSETNEV